MAKVLSNRLAMIVAVSYAVIVACLFALAMVTEDEFGFRFIPVIYATYPLSFLLQAQFGFVPSIVAGAGINGSLLFALFTGIAHLRASLAAK